MIDHQSTTTHLTRRESLAAERHTRRHTPVDATRSTKATAFPISATPKAARAAVLPLFGATAALLLFTVNTTPALAASTVTTATGTTTVLALHGQSFTAGRTSSVVASRDGYSVTTTAVVRPHASPARTVPSASLAATVTAGAGVPPTGTALVRRPFLGITPISSPFGYRSAPCAGCTSFHGGVDLTPGAGTPIGAVAAGTVAVAGWHPNYGQYVILDHLIDGRKISTLYGHMQAGSSPLHVGDTVAAGALVGLVGNTGISTGAHLHLEVRLDGTLPVDPMIWLAAHGA
jgi:murein DD-endopeptidase MepM/ murein hydrolase activator NlpD